MVNLKSTNHNIKLIMNIINKEKTNMKMKVKKKRFPRLKPVHTELDQFQTMKNLGYVYDPETGLIHRNDKEIGYDSYGYKAIKIPYNGKYINIRIHRYGWWVVNNEIPDVINHINYQKDDNRIVNLENTTQLINSRHREFNSKSYSWNKKVGKWNVIFNDGKKHHICYTESESKAIQLGKLTTKILYSFRNEYSGGYSEEADVIKKIIKEEMNSEKTLNDMNNRIESFNNLIKHLHNDHKQDFLINESDILDEVIKHDLDELYGLEINEIELEFIKRQLKLFI